MSAPAPSPSNPGKTRPWLLAAAGVGLFVVGLRWLLLAAYGSAVPYWDEWPVDATELFKPWLQHRFSWTTLFASHNGHRIAFTRLWELAFFVLNRDRWDPLLVQTANAVVVAISAALLAIALARTATPPHRRAALLVAVALLGVPFGYSNLLIAFQSQFAFFVLASVAALACWSGPTLTPRRLAGGLIVAALALFTIGSGVLVSLTLAVLAAWRALRERRRLWYLAALGAALIAAVGIAASTTPDRAPPGAIVAAAGRYLAWPAGNFLSVLALWPDSVRYLPHFAATWPSPQAAWLPALAAYLSHHPGVVGALCWLLGLIVQAPGLCLLVRTIRRRESPGLLAGLVVWQLLNLAAMALARSDQELVPPRYQDILAVGLLTNACALLALLRRPSSPADPAPPCWRRLRPLAWGWAGFMLAVTAVTAIAIFRLELPRKHAENLAAARLIRRYLAAPDPKLFQHQPPNHVPWPRHEGELAHVLRDPAVRDFLPRDLLPDAAPPPAPLASRLAALARKSGGWIATAGLLLLAYALWPSRRDGPFSSQNLPSAENTRRQPAAP